jgi:hypothetical protein
MLKNPSKYERDILEGKIHLFLRAVPPTLLQDVSAVRITREL